MDTLSSGFQHSAIAKQELLLNDEVIVLVDDDEFIREPIRLYFEEFGLAVVEADSGEALWKIIEQQNVAMFCSI